MYGDLATYLWTPSATAGATMDGQDSVTRYFSASSFSGKRSSLASGMQRQFKNFEGRFATSDRPRAHSNALFTCSGEKSYILNLTGTLRLSNRMPSTGAASDMISLYPQMAPRVGRSVWRGNQKSLPSAQFLYLMVFARNLPSAARLFKRTSFAAM
jgi:hypothetical protein